MATVVEAAGSPQVKIAVMGGGGVGKSNLSMRYIQGSTFKFMDSYDPTIEDSYMKDIELDSQPVSLEIYDTAGQDQFASVISNYYRSATCFIFVYSIIDRASVEDAKTRFDELRRIKDLDDKPIPPVALCGNKVDLPDERAVPKAEGEALAKEWGENVLFFETSAKADIAVKEVFEAMAKKGLETLKKEAAEVAASQNNGGCCTVS